MGKGQDIELKLSQIYGKCDDDKYPLHGKDISL